MTGRIQRPAHREGSDTVHPTLSPSREASLRVKACAGVSATAVVIGHALVGHRHPYSLLEGAVLADSFALLLASALGTMLAPPSSPEDSSDRARLDYESDHAGE